MKKEVLLLLLSLTILNGCVDHSTLIKEHSSSTRSGIFEELADGSTTSPGFSDLVFSASLKTHRPNHSESDVHGTPNYRLLLNIDGQAVWIKGKLNREQYESHRVRDPEAGDGIRYHFSSKLRLRPGAHRIVAAVPEDGIAIVREITVPDQSSSLILKPIYKKIPGTKRRDVYVQESFSQGLSSLRVFLNEKEL